MKNQKGFNIIELLATMAIVGVVAGVGVPSMVNSMKNLTANDAFDTIKNAVKRNQGYSRVSGGNRVIVTCAVTDHNMTYYTNNLKCTTFNHSARHDQMENYRLVTFAINGNVSKLKTDSYILRKYVYHSSHHANIEILDISPKFKAADVKIYKKVNHRRYTVGLGKYFYVVTKPNGMTLSKTDIIDYTMNKQMTIFNTGVVSVKDI
jgi:prepilin-type N-terminal cleavage/methylation domain-containing protein